MGSLSDQSGSAIRRPMDDSLACVSSNRCHVESLTVTSPLVFIDLGRFDRAVKSILQVVQDLADLCFLPGRQVVGNRRQSREPASTQLAPVTSLPHPIRPRSNCPMTPFRG